MSELIEAEADLRCVYGELYPHRDPAGMRIGDDVLAAVVLIRREAQVGPAKSAGLHARILDGLSRYNPKDPE